MDLISYRGPNQGGGLSSAVTALWEHPQSTTGAWWHLSSNNLVYSAMPHAPSRLIPVRSELLTDHYAFCNEFMWPIMHGFGHLASFDSQKYSAYTRLQQKIASAVGTRSEGCFVHDYQMALVPGLLDRPSTFFWHIPWPKQVAEVWKPFVQKIATNLLNADLIGFHTEYFADNFLRTLDPAARAIAKQQVVVAPISIDHEMWMCRAQSSNSALVEELGIELPYILSVDRVDYAKGTLERFESIDAFFRLYPEYIGKLSFVQVSARSRTGVVAFDHYWEKCTRLFNRINTSLGKGSWTPIQWLDTAFSADELACLYRNASSLLVTSLGDGLNLTAKEYAICQTTDPGVLVLSKYAGVSTEIGAHALVIDPRDAAGVARALRDALHMPVLERRRRMSAMAKKIASNSLLNWYDRFETKNRRKKSERFSC